MSKMRYPFNIDAFVLLPEDLYCIWTLLPDDKVYSKRGNAINEDLGVKSWLRLGSRVQAFENA